MSAELYERVWRCEEYRDVAPGEILAHRFVELARPKSRIVDFGCGTGRGAALLHALTGQDVIALDWARNCLDESVVGIEAIEFRRHDLREPLASETAEYGYCVDVMEHIAESDVDSVLGNIVRAARRVFFAISPNSDSLGMALTGHPLHLTIKSFDWWRNKLSADLKCRILWEQSTPEHSMFYVCAYAAWSEWDHRVELNVSEDQVRDNIRRNLAMQLREATPHEAQDIDVHLLAGGPSLSDCLPRIRRAARAGKPIVTVNGAYNWCLDHGIRPGAQIMIDARAFNRRFIEPIIPGCKYLLSSQCDPNIVKTIPRDQIWLWHCAGSETVEIVRQELGIEGECYPVRGGSTVMLRALPLLLMLGFRRFHVYGFDSCYRGTDHHAFVQAENDGQQVIDVSIGGRKFRANGWMISQAIQAQKILAVLAQIKEFKIAIHGDGLIAAIIDEAAERMSYGS